MALPPIAPTFPEIAGASALPADLADAYTQVAHTYLINGDLAFTEASLEQALRWSRVLGAADTMVDLLCELAETAATALEASEGSDGGALWRACGHAVEAAQLAARLSDPYREPGLLLRISDVFDRCGRHREATALQTKAMRRLAAREAPAALRESA
jgi:hypothetical protein